MILGIVDNHKMTIVIIRDSFSPGRYVLYCKSLLFTGFDIFSSRNCERTQTETAQAGFGADYQDKSLSKPHKAPPLFHREVKDQNWTFSD